MTRKNNWFFLFFHYFIIVIVVVVIISLFLINMDNNNKTTRKATLCEQIAFPDSMVLVQSLSSGWLINTSKDNCVASNPPGRLDHQAPPLPGIMH
jgi:hypothetical protein